MLWKDITTDSNKDLWFIGSSTILSGSLWIGYDKPLNMKGSASDLAAPLWGWWMRAMHQDLNVPKDFSGRKDQTKYVCRETGKYRNATCKTMPIPTIDGQRPRVDVQKITHHPIQTKNTTVFGSAEAINKMNTTRIL